MPVLWPALARDRSALPASTGPRTCLKSSRCARRGGEDEIQVGQRGAQIVEQDGAVDDMIGAAGGGARLVARPAVARVDQPEFGQAEIRHGARHHADVFAELRLDQDDGRALRFRPRLAVFFCHR